MIRFQMRIDCGSDHYQAQLRTPFGVVGVHCANKMLTGISFLASKSKVQSPSDAFAREVCTQLQAYFEDAAFQFNLPLKLSGTEHQMKVWQAMCEIPSGQVQTYGNLAALLHSSPRAVGQACGNNPIPIVIPCHRVVSKAGLGGFMHSSDNATLAIKRWLLAHEQH
jgi:methylated-DNA-[protein]-cysteine S-methyltransferase